MVSPAMLSAVCPEQLILTFRFLQHERITRGIQLSLNGDWMICLFLPRADRDNLLDLLHEESEFMVELVGRKRAWVWYQGQVIGSVWPIVKYRVYGWVKWAVGAAGINAILHNIRK